LLSTHWPIGGVRAEHQSLSGGSATGMSVGGNSASCGAWRALIGQPPRHDRSAGGVEHQADKAGINRAADEAADFGLQVAEPDR
jgi:hypothetical protein